jgi:hypothetical protein
MILSHDRARLRRMFFEAWRAYRAGQPQEPLQQLIAEIVKFHPEYHHAVEDPSSSEDRDYSPHAGVPNPFLHMGMHIAIQEQLGTDRPPGFRALYQALVEAVQDPHAAEHRIMDCLGETLWQAQRGASAPDEQAYMDCLRGVLGTTTKPPTR